MLVFIKNQKKPTELTNKNKISLLNLIKISHLSKVTIPAIKVNDKIILKNNWANFYIKHNDKIEVISIIAGG